MRDRVPQPGRAGNVKLTLDDGRIFRGKLERDDGALVLGTAFSKATILPDDVANAYNRPDSTPSEIFRDLIPARLAGRFSLATSGTTANGNGGTAQEAKTVILSTVVDPLGTIAGPAGQLWCFRPPFGATKAVLACEMRWAAESFATGNVTLKYGNATQVHDCPSVGVGELPKTETIYFVVDVNPADKTQFISFEVCARRDVMNGTTYRATVEFKSVRVDFM